MKDYYAKLFEYDKYANELILTILFAAGCPEKPVQLMAHLIATQQIWLTRAQKLPPSGIPVWPGWAAGELAGALQNSHQGWINFLSGLQQDDFASVINYQNSKGEAYSNTLGDIATHVINHGTHHRAQAGQLLKPAGTEILPVTDYIVYVRNQRSLQ